MGEEEIYEALDVTEQDILDLKQSLSNLKAFREKLDQLIADQKDEGSEYTMKHIRKLDLDDRLVGLKGLRLKVFENGKSENETVFYFNMRGGLRGIGNDRDKLMLRLLDELSQSCRTTHTQHPKLNQIAKKIYDKYGNEISDVLTLEYDQEIWLSFGEAFICPFKSTCIVLQVHPKIAKRIYDKYGNEISDVMTLEYDQEIWLSFGEAFICPFTYCFQMVCDKVQAYDIIGEGNVVLRETLTDLDVYGHEEVCKWDASIGFPMMYDAFTVINPEVEKQKDHYNHIMNLKAMSEVDTRSHFLQSMMNPNLVLYPELVVSEKLKKGTKEMWPPDSQLWILSKSGYIYCRGVPQLCIGVSDRKVTAPTNRGRSVEGMVVSLQKKMVANPYQHWSFNSDGTLSCEEHPDLVLTYLGNKNGDEESEITNNITGTKAGNKVFMVVCERVESKDSVLQRFALKQERFENLGQWKHTDSTNPEFSKQAYSWPTKQNGSLNEDYDWPMEAFLIPNAPPLHKKPDKHGLSGMPKRLMAVRNGERDPKVAVPVVGPDLTNLLKEAMKHNERQQKKDGRQPPPTDEMDDFFVTQDVVDSDIMLHCQQMTVRQLEFVMFLDHSTSLLALPFAGRRLFDESGTEHFSLANLTRDDLVHVSCGEPWTDPLLTKAEQQRRFLLSQLSHDIEQIQQFVALRNPEDYVLEIEGAIAPNALVSVNRQWTPSDGKGEVSVSQAEEETIREDKYQDIESELDWAISAHDKSHQRSDERSEKLKWPWERLQNATAQFDWSDPNAQNYTDKEMYEKYKPAPKIRAPRDTLQRFDFQDGFLMSSANNDLVLGVREYQGHKNRVMLVKKRIDDVNQRWMMSQTGEIFLKYNRTSILTLNYPTMQHQPTDQSDSFTESTICVQNKKMCRFGRANQMWRYDAETGFIAAFASDTLDKEITAANKTDVCTYTVAGFSALNQPGYTASVSVANKFGDDKARDIRVCTSCARAMRGRHKLTKIKDTESFACAMGQAKKLKLRQIGSFRVLNGRVDLSTHEADLTLEKWEAQYQKLKEETSVKTIVSEISASNVVLALKVLAYKNGEGRLRPGECIVSSSIEGLLTQCTKRLKLPFAATKIYTEDGTLIIDLDDLKNWAVENYQSIMCHRVDNMMGHGSTRDSIDEDAQEDVNISTKVHPESDSQIDTMLNDALVNIDAIQAQTEEQMFQQSMDPEEKKRQDNIMSQMSLPSMESILRYPIEIWVSTGRTFISPDVVESKTINKKKKRIFRSAISLELGIEKHIARQLKGRRLEDLNPGEYKPTLSSTHPVVLEGTWKEESNSERMKQANIKKLEHHYTEVKSNQNDTASLRTANVDLTHRLYRQPVRKRVLVYPNGESVDRAQYVFGETTDEILEQATTRLNLWKNAKYLFSESGTMVTDFDDIERDQLLCVSHGNAYKGVANQVQQEIEVKANWGRARKKYGPEATDYAVSSVRNPQVHVDPFGPPKLALPVNEQRT